MTRYALAACLLVLAPQTAFADAIYGCWTKDAERLVVEYERVITPGGASPQADIDRHNARFVSPEGKRDAGRFLAYRQLHDNAVARTAWTERGGDPVGEEEIWTPCERQVSHKDRPGTHGIAGRRS